MVGAERKMSHICDTRIKKSSAEPVIKGKEVD